MSEKRLWKVEDGETHWVVATSANDAKRQVADAFGFDFAEYITDHEPAAGWAPLTKPVRFNVTGNVRFFQNDYPPGTQVYVELMPAKIVEHMSGLVCSSCW